MNSPASIRRSFVLALAFLLCVASHGQIVNRLRVDQKTFVRYAYGRMQEFSEDNLPLSDSLYREGESRGDFRLKLLGLSLEMPVRFARGEYGRMDETVAEMKDLLIERKDLRVFYFSTLHEYCEFLLQSGRVSEAVLEARAMERLASSEKNPYGKMYSYRIVGLIQSYRDNHYLAIENLKKAARFCREARAEQDLPNLFILLSQEYLAMENFSEAEDYLLQAEEYIPFFPLIRLKAQMTRAYIYNARGEQERFWECYEELVSDPLFQPQTDADTRCALDVTYLRSRGLLEEALLKSDHLGTDRARLEFSHGIYAQMGSFDRAYSDLSRLMNQKDSIYIKVQNEDLAILDAEMNNAQLREEAQQLKARNQMTILLGFLVMFAVAFASILVQQWKLRENLDEMRRKNVEALKARRAFQKAMDAKEAENEYKFNLLKNRSTNVLTDYEDFLNS